VTFEDDVDRWQSLHGGTDPRSTPLVRRWLRAVHALARPLARTGVHPDVLTLLSVVVAVLVLPAPPVAGALLVVLSAGLDGLDGAVALLQDRVTRVGAVLDAVADRVCDLLFVAALVLAGGPWWLGAACGAGLLALEGLRLAARRVLTITVAERPTRVVACAAGLVSLPTVGLGVLGLALLVGLVPLARAWRKQWRTQQLPTRVPFVPSP
jgi:phosphatidylglycerophosphate synthase